MPTAVYQHGFDARRRLAELGVPLDALVRAIEAGKVARYTCTDNDPPFIPGTEAWRFVVRTLRDELLPLGWRKDDPANYSLVINDEKRINIVVATGDQLTRVFPGTPRTRSLKGLYTEAAVTRNRFQDDLFPDTVEEDLKRVAALLAYPVWILLIHIDDEGARAELSLPSAMDGAVIEWAERIFIPVTDDGASTQIIDDDLGPDLDVPVTRKG